jgi:group I intron endonuclease
MFVYSIENKLNGKIYIGKTINSTKRWITHKSVAKGGKTKYPEKYFALHAAMTKYGVDSFEFNLIEYCADNLLANEAEKYWISYLKEFGIKLYNETLGGDGATPGIKFTEEHKKKISDSRKGFKASLETKLNMSKARKLEFAGEKNNKAKMTEFTVREIKSLYKTGKYTHRSLGKLFGLTHGTIGKIISGKLWSHINT